MLRITRSCARLLHAGIGGKALHSFVLLALISSHCVKSQENPVPDTRQAFSPLRYNEDYSYLGDPSLRTEWWDTIKYIEIADGRAGFLSLGGEARERFEAYENLLFSNHPDSDNAYLLQRYLLHTDYHPTHWLRAFAQLQSSLQDGRNGGPRPTDRDFIDVQQLFVDTAATIRQDAWLTVRAGRQEMSYGSERLISVREGLNNRRTFDAVRLLYQQGSIKVDGFISSPVEVEQGAFDN